MENRTKPVDPGDTAGVSQEPNNNKTQESAMTFRNGIVRSIIPLFFSLCCISLGAQAASTLQPLPAPHTQAITANTTWLVTGEDSTVREVLQRWAKQAGWTFNPEHWTPSVDIPLTASATFQGDFISAVQAFVSATELGDTPLQPCFYTNHVLRIVNFNESCDKMSAH
jgi:hypothetical protein